MTINVTRNVVEVNTPSGIGKILSYDSVAKTMIVRDGKTGVEMVYRPDQIRVIRG